MAGALDGIRILELPGSRTQFATFLLAGMGAEVWLVEPPGGSPLRRFAPLARGGKNLSLSFLALNSNKKSLSLDLTQDEGRRQFRRLTAQSDVVVESEMPGTLDAASIGPITCQMDNPGLIWASITPYGSSGPSSNFIGSDLSAQAMGGAMATTGEPNGRVYLAGGSVGDKMAGYTAAAALLVAIFERSRSGRGQFIDVSAQEAVAGQLEHGALYYEFTRSETERGGRLYPSMAFPVGLFPALDGWISLVALQANHWDALVEWIGDPRLAVERFKIGSKRALARDEIDKIISAWSSRHSKHELAREAQKRRIAVAALLTASEVTRDEHLVAAGFFRELAHPDHGVIRLPGHPINASLTPFRLASAAPRVGEHNAEIAASFNAPRNASALCAEAQGLRVRSRPLSRFRVLDLTWVIAGPACTRFLADQGAEVIKIESTQAGDPVRTFGPWLDGMNTAPEGGAAFAQLNRNKRSITLNLKKPEGVALLLRLVAQSDVVVDNFTAGTMDRLGLSYDVLSQVNPKIVMAQISGFGQRGLYAHRVAYGQTLLALTGHYDLIGEAGGPPLLPGYTYTDQAAGMISAFAILAALRHREKTGCGQHLDLSLFQIGASLMSEVLIEPLVNGTERTRNGNGNINAISHGAYRCRGVDSWCVIATWNELQWTALLQEIASDDPSLAEQMRALRLPASEIDSLIERWTSVVSAEDIMMRLQGRGVEAAIVQGARQLLESDTHLHERGYFQPFRHFPSDRTLLTDAMQYRLSDFPRTVASGPPQLGEANDYVFRELLRLKDEEIHQLMAADVIGTAALSKGANGKNGQ